MPTPVIQTLHQTQLIGRQLPMSYLDNRTAELWRGFMPNLGKVEGRLNTDLYSVEVYPGMEYFQRFDPNRYFQKWAAVPVVSGSIVPDGFESLILPKGLYAVFDYRGSMGPVPEFYRWIFTEWIPASEYVLDNRPHFAVMDKEYRKDDPDAREKIWIPLHPTK